MITRKLTIVLAFVCLVVSGGTVQRMLKLGFLRRRPFFAAVVLAVATTGVLGPSVAASGRHDEHWVGSWATAPQGVLGQPSQYNNQTLRLIVHTTIGGIRYESGCPTSWEMSACLSARHTSLFGTRNRASSLGRIGH